MACSCILRVCGCARSGRSLVYASFGSKVAPESRLRSSEPLQGTDLLGGDKWIDLSAWCHNIAEVSDAESNKHEDAILELAIDYVRRYIRSHGYLSAGCAAINSPYWCKLPGRSLNTTYVFINKKGRQEGWGS